MFIEFCHLDIYTAYKTFRELCVRVMKVMFYIMFLGVKLFFIFDLFWAHMQIYSYSSSNSTPCIHMQACIIRPIYTLRVFSSEFSPRCTRLVTISKILFQSLWLFHSFFFYFFVRNLNFLLLLMRLVFILYV